MALKVLDGFGKILRSSHIGKGVLEAKYLIRKWHQVDAWHNNTFGSVKVLGIEPPLPPLQRTGPKNQIY